MKEGRGSKTGVTERSMMMWERGRLRAWGKALRSCWNGKQSEHSLQRSGTRWLAMWMRRCLKITCRGSSLSSHLATSPRCERMRDMLQTTQVDTSRCDRCDWGNRCNRCNRKSYSHECSLVQVSRQVLFPIKCPEPCVMFPRVQPHTSCQTGFFCSWSSAQIHTLYYHECSLIHAVRQVFLVLDQVPKFRHHTPMSAASYKLHHRFFPNHLS